MTTPARASGMQHVRWLGEVRGLVDAVDQAVYDTVADTPTPRLDRLLVGVSTAANYSRLCAAVVAVVGGPAGRRAARQGVLSIAFTSAVTNLVLKPLARRQRPTRSDDRPVPDSRRVRRPVSASVTHDRNGSRQPAPTTALHSWTDLRPTHTMDDRRSALR
jgi:hypothetical protein